MTNEQILALLEEAKGELNTPPGFSDATLTKYIKAGEYDIKSIVDNTIDFTTDLKARALLISYVRYSYYGLRDEFKVRFDREYQELQIEYA